MTTPIDPEVAPVLHTILEALTGEGRCGPEWEWEIDEARSQETGCLLCLRDQTAGASIEVYRHTDHPPSFDGTPHRGAAGVVDVGLIAGINPADHDHLRQLVGAVRVWAQSIALTPPLCESPAIALRDALESRGGCDGWRQWYADSFTIELSERNAKRKLAVRFERLLEPDLPCVETVETYPDGTRELVFHGHLSPSGMDAWRASLDAFFDDHAT